MKRLKKSDIRVQLEEIEDQKKSNSQAIFEHKQARSTDHEVGHQKSLEEEKEIERTETCVIQNESSPDLHGNSPNYILEEMFD